MADRVNIIYLVLWMAHILIVDDDPHARLLFRCVLSKDGHEITEACDGEKGYRLFCEQQPDLVITDVLMPNKEGLELIQEIKDKQAEIKVIALSGGGMIDKEDCLIYANAFGADLVFPKPIRPTVLAQAVNCLLLGTVFEFDPQAQDAPGVCLSNGNM